MRQGKAWSGTVWQGMVRYGEVLLERSDVVWHGTVRLGVARRG